MSVQPQTGWRRWVWPLLSRKVQVAIGGAVAAYLIETGIDAQDVVDRVIAIAAIILPTVAVILGIAHEDAGAKSAGK